MFLTTALTKKSLEELISFTFQNLSISQGIELNDSLKAIGFYYATLSGLSIGITDLKTTNYKTTILNNIEKNFEKISSEWSLGLVSDIERFKKILDNWNFGTEILKTKILNHFFLNDPLNSLYIMAFSGARGNIGQVRQVIGMRGLMVNQEGNIIDTPIKTNFREGLTIIDYLVSSYGARKGVVDTALKTADAGYLTRRLIYVVQEIIVTDFDCKTTTKLFYHSTSNKKQNSILKKDLIFNKKIFETKGSLNLYYRSPLTCLSLKGICQKCYGSDINKKKYMNLGLPVGIIAAQSIGEPGTQLTMRTFHTGGVLTSQMIKQNTAKITGKLLLPENLVFFLQRNLEGKIKPILVKDLQATILTLNGEKKKIILPRNSFLNFYEKSFVQKNEQIIEEINSLNFGNENTEIRKHTLKVPMDSEILTTDSFINLKTKKKIFISPKKTLLWLASGETYSTFLGAKIFSQKIVKPLKSIAQNKIISPINGICYRNNKEFLIFNKNQKIKLELEIFSALLFKQNCRFEFLVKNYQYVDVYTILGNFFYFPKICQKIYKIKKKENSKNLEIFYITEKDIWKIYFDQPYKKKTRYLFSKDKLTLNIKSPSSGLLLKKEGFYNVYQKAFAVILPAGSILPNLPNQFMQKNEILAYLFLNREKSQDIVQGLPKIHQIFEARHNFKNINLFPTTLVFLANWEYQKIQIKEDLKKNNKKIIRKINVLPSKNWFLELSEKDFDLNFFRPSINKCLIVKFGGSFYRLQTTIPRFWADLEASFLFSEARSFNFIKNLDENFELWFNNYAFQKIKIEKIILFGFGNNEYIINNEKLKNFNSFFSSKNLEKEHKYTYPEFSSLIKYLRFYTKSIGWFKLISFDTHQKFKISSKKKLKFKISQILNFKQNFISKFVDAHILLNSFFIYHSELDGVLKGTLRSFTKLQLILLNSIQNVYISQGVEISNRHIELILREMTKKICILEKLNTPFFPGEIINFPLILRLDKILKNNNIASPIYKPILLGISKTTLQKSSFLAAIGFQEAKSLLTKAAIEGKKDWFFGLKESIILTRLIPAGTNFFSLRTHLDQIIKYKNV